MSVYSARKQNSIRRTNNQAQNPMQPQISNLPIDPITGKINPEAIARQREKDKINKEKELIFREAFLQQRKFVIDSQISKLSLSQNYLENSQTDLEKLMVLRKEKQTILETIGSLSLAKKEVN